MFSPKTASLWDVCAHKKTEQASVLTHQYVMDMQKRCAAPVSCSACSGALECKPHHCMLNMTLELERTSSCSPSLRIWLLSARVYQRRFVTLLFNVLRSRWSAPGGRWSLSNASATALCTTNLRETSLLSSVRVLTTTQ